MTEYSIVSPAGLHYRSFGDDTYAAFKAMRRSFGDTYTRFMVQREDENSVDRYDIDGNLLTSNLRPQGHWTMCQCSECDIVRSRPLSVARVMI